MHIGPTPVVVVASQNPVKVEATRRSNSHFGSLRGRQPQPRVMTVPQPPGSAAILAASGAGETPALPGKAGPEVQWCTFLFKMSIAVFDHAAIVSRGIAESGQRLCS